VLSVWEGVERLLHPSAVQARLVGFAVLGLRLIIDRLKRMRAAR
jgi:hypothetical protein